MTADSSHPIPMPLFRWITAHGLEGCLWACSDTVGTTQASGTGTYYAGDIPLIPVLTVEDGGVRHVFHAGCDSTPVPELRACFWLEQVIPPSAPPSPEDAEDAKKARE
jgi:hypothetical protein